MRGRSDDRDVEEPNAVGIHARLEEVVGTRQF
jgi:hypothetical protein